MDNKEVDEIEDLAEYNESSGFAETQTGSTEQAHFDLAKIEAGVRLILEGLGEDPNRPGIQATPGRVAHMYAEICAGLKHDPQEFIKVVPAETHDEMVIVRDIAI